jgi:hypothetical protein
MSQGFRKAMLNRLPPMEATRAPWAVSTPTGEADDEEDNEEEELADEIGELGTM